jgi:uncharacterized BrkB/YihY/UPF0761 family membrane protein
VAIASTILARALPGNPELRDAVLGSALRNLPLVGEVLRRDAPILEGSGVALVVAIALAIWAGLGAVRSLEHGMNAIWKRAVPPAAVVLRQRRSRRSPPSATVGVLVVIGAALAGVARAAGARAGTVLGWSGSWRRQRRRAAAGVPDPHQRPAPVARAPTRAIARGRRGPVCWRSVPRT